MNTERPLAKPTRQLETDRVLVTEWRFPPGGHTGWHKHAYDYVVVPITSGELHIYDGKTNVPAPRSGATDIACAKASPNSRRRTSVNGGGSVSFGSSGLTPVSSAIDPVTFLFGHL